MSITDSPGASALVVCPKPIWSAREPSLSKPYSVTGVPFAFSSAEPQAPRIGFEPTAAVAVIQSRPSASSSASIAVRMSRPAIVVSPSPPPKLGSGVPSAVRRAIAVVCTKEPK